MRNVSAGSLAAMMGRKSNVGAMIRQSSSSQTMHQRDQH
jgi:hypothetical protein